MSTADLETAPPVPTLHSGRTQDDEDPADCAMEHYQKSKPVKRKLEDASDTSNPKVPKIDIDFTDDSKFDDDEKSDEEMITDMLGSCGTMDEVCPQDYIERFNNLRRVIRVMYREFAYHDRKFFEMTDKEQQEFLEAKMCYH